MIRMKISRMTSLMKQIERERNNPAVVFQFPKILSSVVLRGNSTRKTGLQLRKGNIKKARRKVDIAGVFCIFHISIHRCIYNRSTLLPRQK